jgi:integrase
VARRLIETNPFGEVKAASSQPQERAHYVSLEDTAKLLEEANPTWRIIIALARYAGLRCPSELLSLCWADIDFAKGKMVVNSPKTAHIPGKEYRVVPLFKLLRPHLEEAYALAADGAKYVVPGRAADGCRAAAKGPSDWVNANLRTQLSRIIRRAGLPQWPRMFNNLRASASTDIREQFGETAESHWVGHSPAVARRHYSRISDALFALATQEGGAQSGAQVARNAAQQGAASSSKEE